MLLKIRTNISIIEITDDCATFSKNQDTFVKCVIHSSRVSNLIIHGQRKG